MFPLLQLASHALLTTTEYLWLHLLFNIPIMWERTASAVSPLAFSSPGWKRPVFPASPQLSWAPDPRDHQPSLGDGTDAGGWDISGSSILYFGQVKATVQPQPKRRKQTPSQILQVIEHNSPRDPKDLTALQKETDAKIGSKGRDSLQGLRGQYVCAFPHWSWNSCLSKGVLLGVSPDPQCGAGRGQDQCTAPNKNEGIWRWGSAVFSLGGIEEGTWHNCTWSALALVPAGHYWTVPCNHECLSSGNTELHKLNIAWQRRGGCSLHWLHIDIYSQCYHRRDSVLSVLQRASSEQQQPSVF